MKSNDEALDYLETYEAMTAGYFQTKICRFCNDKEASIAACSVSGDVHRHEIAYFDRFEASHSVFTLLFQSHAKK